MSHDINNMNMVAMGKIEMLKQAGICEEKAVAMLDGALDMLTSSSQLMRTSGRYRGRRRAGWRTGRRPVRRPGRREEEVLRHAGQGHRHRHPYVEKDSCLVLANGLIEDIFANLVGNSIKHSTPGRP